MLTCQSQDKEMFDCVFCFRSDQGRFLVNELTSPAPETDKKLVVK